MKTELKAKITIQKESRSFNLTIDWGKMTDEEMRALAQRSIVIAWQNKHRVANEGSGQWPAENPCINAVDYRLGTRTTTVKTLQVDEMTVEQLAHYAQLIATAQAKLV